MARKGVKRRVTAEARETATKERLQHAPPGAVEAFTGADAKQRITDDPLTVLYRNGSLGANSDDARRRYEAGVRLAAHHYHGALVPIGSRDYRQPYAAAGPDRFAIMPASERQAMHRMHFRRAMEALGPGRIGLAVTRIVLEELWPAEAGVSERRDARARTAVAIEFMIEGLDRLVALWGGR